MAMIECPECKKQISDKAANCVNCGVPVTQQPVQHPQQYQQPQYQQQVPYQPVPATKPKKPVFKKWWFWVLVVVGIIIIISAASSGGSNNTPSPVSTPRPSTPTAAPDTGTQQEAETPPPTEAPTPEPTILSRDNSSAELTTLFTGTFFVGQDIPEGRYVITGKGQGNFFVSRSGELMHVVNEILDDGSSVFTIGVPSITVDLIDGDEIEISGINEVVFTPALTELSTVLTAGHWVVGLDIPAGTYDATPTKDDESGNFFVYTSGRMFPEVNEILSGKDSASADMGLGVEKIRVNLKDGQLIHISGISSVTFE